MVTVKRALLSCHDKTGLDGFAKALAALGVELIASGGTAEFLKRHGLRVKTVEEFAGIGEQLDGRVKTLHPKIHAGILARRSDETHVKAVGAEGLIDMVVVNLYPFERTVSRSGVSLTEAIEQIDIGGVALLRAAAKNFEHVAVVSDAAQYPGVLKALDGVRLDGVLARRLAVEAFALTSRYDTWIASYLGAANGSAKAIGRTETVLEVRERQRLRYGENPHQEGAWYVPFSGPVWGLGTLTQLQGKELSYNNLLDMDAALRCLLEFDEPTCVIVKHHSQCGLASAATIEEAYERALACDPESAFGGIVGFNRKVSAALAKPLTATFLEVILAPEVEPLAVEALGKKSNLRVATLDWPRHRPAEPEWRQLLGSWLKQASDAPSAETLTPVTTRVPTDRERTDLLFAWKAAKHVKSNGIVIASGRSTVGIGQGQPSRVGSVRLAIEKAGARARAAVAASDGFFPFPDGIELLAKAGVTAVIQPGGSIRDPDVSEAATQAKLAMATTGVRHFRH
jgi:phosphoribosylaminoimidazolecarboxamide formyltransferase/IMP cyclohydrolase